MKTIRLLWFGHVATMNRTENKNCKHSKDGRNKTNSDIAGIPFVHMINHLFIQHLLIVIHVIFFHTERCLYYLLYSAIISTIHLRQDVWKEGNLVISFFRNSFIHSVILHGGVCITLSFGKLYFHSSTVLGSICSSSTVPREHPQF